MKNQNGLITVEFLGFLVILFLLTVAGSWVCNFVKLTECDFEPGYRCEVIHGVGIIPYASMITVWFETDNK